MKKIKKNVLWLFVLIWMLLIFTLSAQPASLSSQTSGNTINIIASIFVPNYYTYSEAQKEVLISSLQDIIRSVAHFSIFFILAMLIYFAINEYSILIRSKLLFSISASFVYALFDEVHQIFVPGRAFQVEDLVTDFSGIIFGAIFALIIIKLISKLLKIMKIIK